MASSDLLKRWQRTEDFHEIPCIYFNMRQPGGTAAIFVVIKRFFDVPPWLETRTHGSAEVTTAPGVVVIAGTHQRGQPR